MFLSQVIFVRNKRRNLKEHLQPFKDMQKQGYISHRDGEAHGSAWNHWYFYHKFVKYSP